MSSLSPYPFHDRLDHAGTRFKEFGGTTDDVTLSRGATPATTDVPAFLILMEAEEVAPGVPLTRLEYQDFVIDSADYKIGGVEVIPQAGDRITRSNGDVYRVISMGSDEPPYRFVTSKRNRIKIHAERVIIA